MKEKADVMVPRRIEAEQLVVEGVRKPGQRMPKAPLNIRKSVLYRGPGQAGVNRNVLGDIGNVIGVHKATVRDRIVESERRDRQQQAGNGCIVLRRKRRVDILRDSLALLWFSRL